MSSRPTLKVRLEPDPQLRALSIIYESCNQMLLSYAPVRQDFHLDFCNGPLYPFWPNHFGHTCHRLVLSCSMIPKTCSHAPDLVLGKTRTEGLKSRLSQDFHADVSYLVLFSFGPLPHGCLPLLSLPSSYVAVLRDSSLNL